MDATQTAQVFAVATVIGMVGGIAMFTVAVVDIVVGIIAAVCRAVRR